MDDTARDLRSLTKNLRLAIIMCKLDLHSYKSSS